MTLADELARLADLHRAGELTDQEYDTAKQSLLGGRDPSLMSDATPPRGVGSEAALTGEGADESPTSVEHGWPISTSQEVATERSPVGRVLLIGVAALLVVGAAVVLVLALGASSDGGGSKNVAPRSTTTTAVPVNRSGVDQVINSEIEGARTLGQVSQAPPSLADKLGLFRVVAGDFQSAQSVLQSGLAGVPEGIVQQNLAATSTLVSAIGAAVACFESVSPLQSDPCSSVVAEMVQKAGGAGTALSALAPYSPRSAAALQQYKDQMLGPRSGS